MPREAKPYLHQGWYCTSAGGMPHFKLCPEADGKKIAKSRLHAYLSGLAQGKTPEAMAEEMGVPAIRGRQGNYRGQGRVLVGHALDDFMDYKAAEFGRESQTYQDYVTRLKPFAN